MIDKKYIGVLDAQDKRWYEYVLNSMCKGDVIVALDKILNWLDCTRVYDCGRPMQTINYGYRTDISGYYYILDKVSDEELRNCYIAKLDSRHAENLNFEKDNPPIEYHKTEQRTSRRNINRTATIEDMFTGTKATVDVGSGRIVRPKENAAIRKAKALNERSVSFAFNNFKVNK